MVLPTGLPYIEWHNFESQVTRQGGIVMKPKQTSRLLGLPLGPAAHPAFLSTNKLTLAPELRQEIYSYILPRTTRAQSGLSHPFSQPRDLWLLGETSLLQTCHQVYEECASKLYGTNTFVVDIKYDSVKFHYTWLTAKGLRPKRLHTFPDFFAPRNIARIRNYLVTVEHVDSYQGMIKYNCGGPGLTAGIESQVAHFVANAARASRISRIEIRLTDGSSVLKDIRKVQVHCVERRRDTEWTQTVLRPLMLLPQASSVQISGSVTPEYAEFLKSAIEREGERIGKTAMSGEGVTHVDKDVLWRWQNNWNA